MTKHIIAIIGGTAALASASIEEVKAQPLVQAMLERLTASFPNAEIQVVKNIGERPAGADIASIGLPNYVGGNEKILVHNFGTKMLPREASSAERSHQWETLRNVDASKDDVADVLGDPRPFEVRGTALLNDIKLDVVNAKMAIIDAEGDEEALYAAYKAGFETLSKHLA